MNIAFFLLPKQEVVTVTHDATLRQTLEKMEHHRYTAVPIINAEGEYAGVVTEGDLLWFMKNRPELTFEMTNKVKLADVPLRLSHRSVRIDANMEDLIMLAKVQNFVRSLMTASILLALCGEVKLLIIVRRLCKAQLRLRHSLFQRRRRAAALRLLSM